LLALALLCSMSPAALADKRVALVIGNSAYRNAAQLANPVNDAVAIANLLTSAGFELVDLRQNLDGAGLRRALREFSLQTRDADIAVVFFAGHGIEANGTNYLVPIDAELARDIDVEDETVSLDRVLATTEAARRLRLVLLDACRDNPFVQKMVHTLASRSIGRGLARIEPITTDTLVAFAARAGSIAIDGAGTNSPFTAALLKHLATPGLDVRLALGRVRDEVLANTRRQQEPFVYGSLGGSDLALVPAPAAGAPSPPPSALGLDERRDYELADKVGSIEAWDWFLRQYARGFYHDLAIAQRAKLVAARAALEPPKKVPDAPAAAPSSEPPIAVLAPPPSRPDSPARPPAPSTGAADNAIVRDAKALREIHDRLYELNFDPGAPEDGRRIREAIRDYQVANHLSDDGQPTEGLLRRLREASPLSPWGAIVYSKGANWGMSWGHTTRKQAVDSAHSSCGSAQCSAELSFAGTECGAFASSASGWALVARDRVEAAKEAALGECAKRGKACRVVAAVCADGTGRLGGAN
jgi:hypothetical protein